MRYVMDGKGPILTAYIGLPAQLRKLRLSSGAVAAMPRAVTALLDTGSSMSVIDIDIMHELRMHAEDMLTVSSLHAPLELPLFNLHLQIPQLHGAYDTEIGTIGARISGSQGIQCLIGRDVLQECVFTYDGIKRSFMLNFSSAAS